MKEFNIKITDDEVYINDKLCECSRPMDKENHEDDLNKRAILALADEMGYEAIFLFEEMAYRLYEMLNEFDDSTDTIDIEELQTKRWELLPDIDNDTLKTWLDALLESKNKIRVEELSDDEILAEIEEAKGSIDNFKAFGDRHSIIDCEEYIKLLEELRCKNI